MPPLAPGPYKAGRPLVLSVYYLIIAALTLPLIFYFQKVGALSLWVLAPLPLSALIPFLFLPRKIKAPLAELGALCGALVADCLLPTLPSYYPSLTVSLSCGAATALGGALAAMFPRYLKALYVPSLILASVSLGFFSPPALLPLEASYELPQVLKELYPFFLMLPLCLAALIFHEIPRLPFVLILAAWAFSGHLAEYFDGSLYLLWLAAALFTLPELWRSRLKYLYASVLFLSGLLELLAPSLGKEMARALFLLCQLLLCALNTTVRQLSYRAERLPKPNLAEPKHGALIPLLSCKRTLSYPKLLTSGGLVPYESLSCALLNKLGGGPYTCQAACLGMGDCVNLCPAGAISFNEERLPVAQGEKCRLCGLCVRSCPKGLWSLVPKDFQVFIPCKGTARMKEMDAICQAGCLGCGLCRKGCPFGAISRPTLSALAVVDQEQCVGKRGKCHWECTEACPRGILQKNMGGGQ
jgi:ferredoxin